MQDVRVDRNKYIGGSDIPIILGISPFKTRFELLQEKAGIIENDFKGNSYTEYGNEMEEVIRDHIAEVNNTIFFEGKSYAQIENSPLNIRCHTDGENDDTVLEIKTTSQVHDDIEGYWHYVCQLLFYMMVEFKSFGILAVYERPEDFNTEFDNKRVQEFHINIDDYKAECDMINEAVNHFIEDYKRIVENPLLSEEDFMPKDIVDVTNSIVALEYQLEKMKETEKKIADYKKQLKKLMEENGVKTFETNNGYRLTLVDDIPSTKEVVEVFNETDFKNSHPRIYKKFIEKHEKVKKGRSGYVLITMPKKEK